jgi:hypothetical protein
VKSNGIGSKGIINNINMMCKIKNIIIKVLGPSYTMG